MMKRQDKQALIDEVILDIKGSKALVFSDFKGVSVKHLMALRGELRKTGSKFKVLKKTFLHIALEKAGIAVDGRKLDGQVGVAFSSDEVAAAKAIVDFAKANKDVPIAIVGGALEGKGLAVDEVKALAKLPSKDELRGQLAGTLLAPISAFARVLSGNITGLVRVLKAVEEKKA